MLVHPTIVAAVTKREHLAHRDAHSPAQGRDRRLFADAGRHEFEDEFDRPRDVERVSWPSKLSQRRLHLGHVGDVARDRDFDNLQLAAADPPQHVRALRLRPRVNHVLVVARQISQA